ncbi:hypothetical protein ACFQ1M_07860 [Sungkyunkwania multivorans]|uniref:DUF4252 domain-containing protein n=1 Tax=Sungkyunkwania multivorans TaxID=1173618 RepID=A0ABW3CX70_9FLAO
MKNRIVTFIVVLGLTLLAAACHSKLWGSLYPKEVFRHFDGQELEDFQMHYMPYDSLVALTQMEGGKALQQYVPDTEQQYLDRISMEFDILRKQWKGYGLDMRETSEWTGGATVYFLPDSLELDIVKYSFWKGRREYYGEMVVLTSNHKESLMVTMSPLGDRRPTHKASKAETEVIGFTVGRIPTKEERQKQLEEHLRKKKEKEKGKEKEKEENK